MKKRVLALLLSAMTVITMVGCGEKDGSVEGTEVVESTESTESKVSELPAVDLAKYDYNGDGLVTLCDSTDSHRRLRGARPGGSGLF